ncbi:hypothetical protein V6C53_02920 [Desulfocurvibacter africanus]|uniref:hypothetical protein n=1 Tax=Desulfocurvibacter africanus TaxID=873 RepID=UPI002FD89F4D
MRRFVAFLFFVAILSFQMTAHADMKAYSEDGKTVLLHNNGQWSYLSTEGSPKEFVEGKQVKYKMYYDNAKWYPAEHTANRDQDYMFNHANGKVYALITSEPLPLTYAAVNDAVLFYTKEVDASARMTKREMRKVNGKMFDFFRIEAKVHDIGFTYYYHVYIDRDSTTQIITYTFSQYANELSPILLEFVNGFVK